MTPNAPRRRGRPAAGTSLDTRERILSVARGHFAAKGFAGSSMRSIARDAGVDPSLISHYFGDKAGLLVAMMELPINPLEVIESVFEQGFDGMGARLVHTFLDSWDPHRDVFSALLRTTFGSGDPTAMPILEFLRNVLIVRLHDVLEGEDVDLRAALIAAELIGMTMLRYVVQLEPLASASPQSVADWYGPAMQELMTPTFGSKTFCADDRT